MPREIHPSAIVHPDAVMGDDIIIGPNVFVGQHVRLGERCRIWANAYLTGFTTIGEDCQIHMGAVIGHEPQDKSFDDIEPTYLEIGQRNVFREYCTVHRASIANGTTVIGNDGFFMAHSHIAHDCRIGNEVVICNNSLVAGHVEIGDRVFVSGISGIHQFARIGSVCMVGGNTGVAHDLPPYTTGVGRSEIRGLNTVGMRRAEIGPHERLLIKSAYKKVFAGPRSAEGAMEAMRDLPDEPTIQIIRDFFSSPSKRGFCWPSRQGGREVEELNE